MSVLKVENLSLTIKGKSILDNISFDVSKNDIVAIVGHNGSGKSSLIDVILGNINADKNHNVVIDKNEHIGIVYDNFNFFPLLKVQELINYIAKTSNSNINKEELYTFFKLGDLKESYIKELSKGERKKLSIVLSLLTNPTLLIMDEPFANVDPIIIDVITKCITKDDRTIIYATNEWHIAQKFSTKIILLKNGKQLGKTLDRKDLENINISNKKFVVNYSDEILEIVKNSPHYISDNLIHIFKNDNSTIFSDLSRITTNISILKTDLIDYYLYTK